MTEKKEWTTQRPTESGWYWVVVKSKYGICDFVKLLEVEITDDGKPYYEVCDNYVWGGIDRIDDFSEFSHFMGPIQSPELPK